MEEPFSLALVSLELQCCWRPPVIPDFLMIWLAGGAGPSRCLLTQTFSVMAMCCNHSCVLAPKLLPSSMSLPTYLKSKLTKAT